MFELKKIQYAKHASQETACYQASLHYKGKKIATVGNDGHGGCDYQHIDDQAAWRELESEVAKLDAGNHAFTYQPDIEGLCCYKVNDWLDAKELKRLMSKRVIYTRNDGKPGIYQTNCAPRAAVRDAWCQQIKGDSCTAVVLNLEPFEEALKIFRAETR